MYFQHIIFEARFRKYSQPHKEKFFAESSLNFGIYLIFISYKFVFHFTWSYLSISVSSNTWINDMIKLNNQPCAYISTTTLHSLTSQEVNFEWGRGKIIKSLLLTFGPTWTWKQKYWTPRRSSLFWLDYCKLKKIPRCSCQFWLFFWVNFETSI